MKNAFVWVSAAIYLTAMNSSLTFGNLCFIMFAFTVDTMIFAWILAIDMITNDEVDDL